MKYRSVRIGCLTSNGHPVQGQCLAGSLTGAVASQRVTEAPKGPLSPVGNRVASASAQAGLTARTTVRAGTKVGTSDPVPVYGRGIAQRDKRYPWDNRLIISQESISTGWFGTSMSARRIPGLERSQGSAVRRLKRHVSWVQNVVRQFGLYPLRSLEC